MDSPLTLGIVLSATLLAGFLAGWILFSRLGLRSPNAWVTVVILLAGSVGGPAVTYHVLGARPLSYVLALLAAGFAAGVAFWPMGRTQGTREWL